MRANECKLGFSLWQPTRSVGKVPRIRGDFQIAAIYFGAWEGSKSLMRFAIVEKIRIVTVPLTQHNANWRYSPKMVPGPFRSHWFVALLPQQPCIVGQTTVGTIHHVVRFVRRHARPQHGATPTREFPIQFVVIIDNCLCLVGGD